MLTVAFIVTSCTKAGKLNRRLDGEWNLVTYDGQALPAGATVVLQFSKEKKGKGTYTMTSNMPPAPAETDNGTY